MKFAFELGIALWACTEKIRASTVVTDQRYRKGNADIDLFHLVTRLLRGCSCHGINDGKPGTSRGSSFCLRATFGLGNFMKAGNYSG